MNYGKEGFLPIVLFMAFVLWNFDHRNFGFVFPKFLLYWAKWNVSTTEQNRIFFTGSFPNSSSNPVTDFLYSGIYFACGKPEFTELAVHKSA